MNTYTIYQAVTGTYEGEALYSGLTNEEAAKKVDELQTANPNVYVWAELEVGIYGERFDAHVEQPQDIQRENVAQIDVVNGTRGAKVTLLDGRVFNVSWATYQRLFDADYFTVNTSSHPYGGKVATPRTDSWLDVLEAQYAVNEELVSNMASWTR